MAATIGHSFHWTGMHADVVKFCENCLVCAKAKHPTKKYGKMPEKSTTVWPWFEIAIDSIGSYGDQGFCALTIMDTTTRLLEVVPALDGSSNEAAYLFDMHGLCRYPRPTQCIFDSGSEFKGELPVLMESYEIRGIRTTVRNPQTNSTIERVHRVNGEKMWNHDLRTQDE
ncbi:Pol Polyprotein [Phytophthora megakarya]|uniref:Pol Polyprotein n=1 Tax=Phytophthora megakarya TaxID=4795 RepID=A0A225WBP6_9STRA|nr:Pol Polyprotein [Phytophthora megakarya]